MVNKYMFEEIMSQKNENKTSVSLSLDNMFRYVSNIELTCDKDYNPFYKVETKQLYEKNLEMSDLFELNQYGWCLNDDKEFLILYI